MEKKNLLKDGSLDHEKILSYINDIMRPEEVKKPLIEGTDKCIKEHGKSYYINSAENALIIQNYKHFY